LDRRFQQDTLGTPANKCGPQPKFNKTDQVASEKWIGDRRRVGVPGGGVGKKMSQLKGGK